MSVAVDPLYALKVISEKIGNDLSLIQGAGGNTSFKTSDTLWVKASGKSLANSLKEDIFVELPLKEVLQDYEQPLQSHNQSKALRASSLRPSIETSLHGLMPHRFVFHTHSIEVIAASICFDGAKSIKDRLKSFNVTWIPYHRPGQPLATAVAKALKHHQYDVLVLENHGLVVGSDSADSAYQLQADVIDRLRQPPREVNNYPDMVKLSAISKQLPGSYIPSDPVIHSLATDSLSFQLAKLNPYCPDHIVFCGMHPWIVSSTCPMPGKDHIYGLVPGIGTIILKSGSPAIEAMLKAQAEVFLRISDLYNINLLTDSQCFELTNWEAEKYRKSMARSN